MIKRLKTIMAGLGLAALTCPFAAQAQLSPEAFGQDDMQVRATFTLPFGGESSTSDHAPKLALGLRSDTGAALSDTDWMRRRGETVSEAREINFALTFTDTPTLMLNQAPIMAFGDTMSAKDDGGLDTYDKTVLGIIAGSLVLIVGAVAVASF